MNVNYNYRGFQIVEVRIEIETDEGPISKITHFDVRENGTSINPPVFQRREDVENWIDSRIAANER